MDTGSRTVVEILAAIGRRAHCIVTRRELLAAVVSDTEIRKRVRKGLLITQHRGVYRVGHAAPSVEASFIAAVKACGEGTALSDRAAAYLLGLVKKPPPRPEVTAPTERRVRGPEASGRRLSPGEVTRVKGIHVTSVPRTLVDLAAVLT